MAKNNIPWAVPATRSLSTPSLPAALAPPGQPAPPPASAPPGRAGSLGKLQEAQGARRLLKGSTRAKGGRCWAPRQGGYRPAEQLSVQASRAALSPQPLAAKEGKRWHRAHKRAARLCQGHRAPGQSPLATKWDASMVRQEPGPCTPTAEEFQGKSSLLLSTNTWRWGQKWKKTLSSSSSSHQDYSRGRGDNSASQNYQETPSAPTHQWDLQSIISKDGNLMGTRNEGLVLRQGTGTGGFWGSLSPARAAAAAPKSGKGAMIKGTFPPLVSAWTPLSL